MDTRTLNSHEVKTIKSNEHLVDIVVKMDAKKRNEFVRLFPNRLDAGSSCFTTVAQNGLAEYRLKKFREDKGNEHKTLDHLIESLQEYTETFPNLEALLNNPPITGDIAVLENAVRCWYETINQKIRDRFSEEEKKIEDKIRKINSKDELKDPQEQHHDFQKRHALINKQRDNKKNYKNLISGIKSERQLFLNEIQKYKTKVKNSSLTGLEKIKYFKKLFDFQSEDPEIYSLGRFISTQYTHLFDEGIKQAKKITRSNMVLDHTVTLMSDIRKAFQNKMSFYAARFNSRDPIPASTIQYIQRAFEEEKEQKWLSLRDHININNPQMVDEVLRYLEGTNKKTKTSWWAFAMPMAALIEIARTLICFAFATVSFVLRLTIIFRKLGEWIDKGIRWINKKSPVQAVTHKINESSIEQLGENSERAELLRHAKGNPDSYCTTLTDQYISGEIWFKEFIGSIKKTFHSIKTIAYKNPEYLFFQAGKARRELVIKAIHRRESHQEPTPTHQESKYANTLAPMTEPTHPSPTPWIQNNYFSFLDPGTKIAYELAHFVDRPIRHTPILATGAFILANTSLAALAIDGVGAKLGLGGKFLLQDIPTKLAKAFTGSDVTDGFLPKMIAAFLEWKLSYASGELMSAIYHGDIEALKKILPEMEPAILYIIGLTSVGASLKYILELTDGTRVGDLRIPILNTPVTKILPFMPVFDSLIEESEHTSHGVSFLNAPERIFIGIQFLLWARTIMSGTHAPDKNAIDQEARKLLDDIGQAKEPSNEQSRATISHFGKARSNLIFSICKVHDKLFHSTNEALSYYDHLDCLFDEYNREAIKINPDLLIDKDIYLNKYFYNRYCHKGSVSLVKIATLFGLFGALSLSFGTLGVIIPLPVFYLATLAWRATKYALATPVPTPEEDSNDDKTHAVSTPWKIARFVPRLIQRILWNAIRCLTDQAADSPVIRHQIEKSFAKEQAMLFQVISATTEILHVATRYIGYVVRTAVALCVCILTFGAPLFDKGFRDFLFKRIADDVNPHKYHVTDPLKPIYARLTTTAGTDSQYIEKCAVDVITKISRAKSTSSLGLETTSSEREYKSPLNAGIR